MLDDWAATPNRHVQRYQSAVLHGYVPGGVDLAKLRKNYFSQNKI